MPHNHPILLTTILAIVVGTSIHAQGNGKQPCKCHHPVGTIDVLYSWPPLHERGDKPVRIRFYFDYNKKLAVGYEEGNHEIDWALFDGNKRVYYERKRDGTCIEYTTDYPLSRCVPDDAEYMGVSIENGVEVDGWKKRTGPNSYLMYVLDKNDCHFTREVNVPYTPDGFDVHFYNYSEGHLYNNVFDKNIDDCVIYEQITTTATTTPEKNYNYEIIIDMLKKCLSDLKKIISNYLK